jgi:DNA-binding protein StpA
MMADGITPEQLAGHNSVSPTGSKKHPPRPAKYRFTDHTGAEKTWTGQGCMPKPLATAVAEGKSLDSFLI